MWAAERQLGFNLFQKLFQNMEEIYFESLHSSGWTGIAQSVQGLATGWTVRGSNPGGG
jgi:hypothetical protein